MQYSITIGDIINIFLLILTLIGLVFTAAQLIQTKKINRASLVKELYWTLYSEKELRDVFYRFEWSNYEEGEFEICNTEMERSADKLLSFFEVICNLYYRGVLKKTDIELFDYEMQRVFSHPVIQEYLLFLDRWQSNQRIGKSYTNYKKYCMDSK